MKTTGNSHRHSLRRSPLTPATTTLLNRNGSSPIDFASSGVPAGLLHSLPHSSSVYRSFREKHSTPQHQPSQSPQYSKTPTPTQSITQSNKQQDHESLSITRKGLSSPSETTPTEISNKSPTLSSGSATKNVYATIVRQLDSSPSSVRRSFHHHPSHQAKFPTTNRLPAHIPVPHTRPLTILSTSLSSPSPSTSSPLPHSPNIHQPNGSNGFQSNNNSSAYNTSHSNNTANISINTYSPSITKSVQFSNSNGDTGTDYSTLQYSPASRDTYQRHNSEGDNSGENAHQNTKQSSVKELKPIKMNSKRYSMDVQDFIHRPSGSSTSESSNSAIETLSSVGMASLSLNGSGNNNGISDNNRRESGNRYLTSHDANDGSNGTSALRNSESPEGYFDQGQYVTLDTSVNQTNGSNSSTTSRQCDKYGFFIDENANIEREPRKPTSSDEMKSVREREAKWLHMLNNWKYYINFKWDKIRDRCRKGIPHSLRSQAWFYLCGGHLQKRRHPRKFKELLTQKVPDDVRNEIQKDLHRQFPSHEMFAERGGTGQTDLFNVLRAFAAYKPKIGYCQAQGPIAAVLLMHMPAEHAFWSLVSLNDYYIGGYFRHNLEEIQIQGQMLFAYLKKFSPTTYNLLKRQNIDPILYMTEWFMCIYSRTLSWSSVLRVWDMFLCEGVAVLFKVGIYLVDVSLRRENTKSCPSMYETCQKLRQIPEFYLREENLVKGLKTIALKDTDVVREHKIQLKRFRKQKTTEVR